MIDYFDINNTIIHIEKFIILYPTAYLSKAWVRCNFHTRKLPIKLSQFHQQILLACKISFHHKLSPHKMLFWNNCLITSRKTNRYFSTGRLFLKGTLYFVMDITNP